MKRRHLAVLVVAGLIATGSLIAVRRCSRKGRTSRRWHHVDALRIELIIRPEQRQETLTARLYERTGTEPLRVEHLPNPQYVRVVGGAFERRKLRGPGEAAPVASATAIAFTIPTDRLRREQRYVFGLSGRRDESIGEYAFTTR